MSFYIAIAISYIIALTNSVFLASLPAINYHWICSINRVYWTKCFFALLSTIRCAIQIET